MKPRMVINQPTNLDRIPREQLVAQLQVLQAQLGEARTRFYALNSMVCALLKEKHGGRAFVSIATFAETQGWTVDMLPQKALGNIRMIAVDGNGHAQIADDKLMAPTDVPCCFEGCGAPATFAEGVDGDGKPVNARCSAHLPENAQIRADQPIVAGTAVEKEEIVPSCGECGRKGMHWPHCSHYNES